MSGSNTLTIPRAVVANGDDLSVQIEALEEELRDAHERLDGVMCALGSLLRSPAMTPQLRVAIRDAIEPAASALASGANRMIARVSKVDPGVASGW
ncbi:MAG: hypothetical protein AAGA54_15255 [Myxococcota bacterium]